MSFWLISMLICNGNILSLQAYEVMAGANLLPRLLEAAHACGRAELAALLLMSLPLVSGNLLHRGGSEALMQPLMQACSRAAGDAFERCMVRQLTCLESDKQHMHQVACIQ